ncbi:ETEC_3214 domain-containing protein [Xenorhabdus bovienii]|uniref:ETEC_3214 domain-containing protein n=1 Tax=Xenorhabdus bovienii TaxID=40576 RepID=UPI0023B2CAF1|nr:ETEC_3214 domain-containing protein [Xenorhabdus bovienii]
MKRKILAWMAAFGAFVSAVVMFTSQGFSLLNGTYDVYQNISEAFFQKKAEDNLNVIYTGTSIKYIESIFGSPVRELHSKEGIHEYIYSFKKFYLQVVYDNNNTVIFYAVTSKDKDFHPNVPYLNVRLGELFTHYGQNYQFLYSGFSSKFYEYMECHYLGNPDNYRNFYLSYNPAGVDYQPLQPLPDFTNDKRSPPKTEDIIRFRNNNAPNTFAVGDIHGSPDGRELFYGIGIDYYDARDIPDKD